MDQQNEYVKKPSYTSRLLEQLVSDVPDVGKNVIDSIKAFASAQSLLIGNDDDNEKDDSIVQFGKYRNKAFVDINKLDHNYCLWLYKQQKYLRAGQIVILKGVLNIN